MARPLGLFAGFGVELEYMLVDRETLDVRPIADELLKAVAGQITGDVEFERTGWSNELALHVIELKTPGPAAELGPLAEVFQADVRKIDGLLAPLGARLLPGAMHPWMDPERELRLWPHEYNAVYAAFDRIFDCRGHGWANLQSVHLNLPFADAEEFGRLHAAIRVVLPLLPALAASSPFADGVATGLLDTRLENYRRNSARVPSVAGRVVPEPVFTPEAYQREILERIYADLRPHDPDGVLQDEFANARGAIARFSRHAIEIRVLDIQEHPAADLAILALTVEVLRGLCDGSLADAAALRAVPVAPLERVFLDAVRSGGAAELGDVYARLLGLDSAVRTAGDLWRSWFERCVPAATRSAAGFAPLRLILERGTLAERLLRAAGPRPERAHLRAVYGRLADCLRDGRSFAG